MIRYQFLLSRYIEQTQLEISVAYYSTIVFIKLLYHSLRLYVAYYTCILKDFSHVWPMFNMILLRKYFCIGLIIGPKLAVLTWGEAEGQYSWPRTNNKANTEIHVIVSLLINYKVTIFLFISFRKRYTFLPWSGTTCIQISVYFFLSSDLVPFPCVFSIFSSDEVSTLFSHYKVLQLKIRRNI